MLGLCFASQRVNSMAWSAFSTATGVVAGGNFPACKYRRKWASGDRYVSTVLGDRPIASSSRYMPIASSTVGSGGAGWGLGIGAWSAIVVRGSWLVARDQR